eukprot:2615797-Pyramimonas_sp.AAC.1
MGMPETPSPGVEGQKRPSTLFQQSTVVDCRHYQYTFQCTTFRIFYRLLFDIFRLPHDWSTVDSGACKETPDHNDGELHRLLLIKQSRPQPPQEAG